MEWAKIRRRLAGVCKASDIKTLGVFGSVARGDDSPASDVDLLVTFNKPIGFVELHDIEQRLQAVFGRRVDLGTEASLHPLIRADVKKDLKIIYEG